MKLRANHIVAIVLVSVAAVVALAVASSLGSGSTKVASEQEFLESIRRQAEHASRDTEVGWMAGGKIEVSTDHFKMGVVPHDKKTKGSFLVYNKGEEELSIGEIQTSCACTLGTMRQKEIPPGGEAPLEVEFDPYRVMGFEATRVLTIPSSDPLKPSVEVYVTAQIDPEFSLQPDPLDLGTIPKGEKARGQVVWKQVAEAPADILAILPQKKDNGLEVSFAKRPESEWSTPGKAEYVIDVVLDTSKAPVGPIRAGVPLKTNVKRFAEPGHEFSFLVQANVVKPGAGRAQQAAAPVSGSEPSATAQIEAE